MLAKSSFVSVMVAVVATFTVISCGHLRSSRVVDSDASWFQKNAAVVESFDLKTRDRRLPALDVPEGIQAGNVYELGELPQVELAPGVSATISWGRGALLELVEVEPQAIYPTQVLNEELITYVEAGSGSCETASEKLDLEAGSLLYLTPGMQRTLRAGANGLKLIEVFSPVRPNHIRLTGIDVPQDAKLDFPDQGVTPSIEAGRLYNLNNIQLTGLTPPLEGNSYKRSTAQARLVWGRNAMLSFIRMDPGSSFPWHIHPEDQHMIALRGALEEGIMGDYLTMNGDKRHVVFQPGGMAHSANLSEFGADALDVFWPVRPDYMEKAAAQQERLDEVIEPGTIATKLTEGFIFAEGGVWIDDAFFFTDMYFEADWTGDPERSALIKMDVDGTWSRFVKGMQMNGTIRSKTGNLIVCDMFGHRVVEIDSKSGEVVRTLLSEVNGKPIDGPNDLVMDSAGGIYVSDPQFTPEAKKSQPGKQVYYIPPEGAPRVVIPAGELAFPNGVAISPDGNTFYVNNTWYAPGENYVWAYDIEADGSLSGKRQFAKLNLTGDVLSHPDPAQRVDARADGMAIDTDGRLYVTTLSGVQIFDQDGNYVGTIWCPQNPANCAFGGPNNDILFMVGGSSAWAVQTKVKGFAHPRS